MELPGEKSKRFVAILNKKVEVGRLMNALGHTTAGLVASIENKDSMCFLQYRDADDGIHPNISHFGFIILKADNSNQIRTVRKLAIERGIPFSDFTSTMTIGTSAQQQENTGHTKEEDLEYFCITMFGDTDELKDFTGKFSLFT